MTSNIYQQRSCLLCQSTSLSRVLTLKSTPLGDQYVTKKYATLTQPLYPIVLKLCNNCGHAQLKHIVRPESIYLKYIYQTVSSPGLRKHFREYAQFVIDRVLPAKDTLVVDIGSNDGTLLREFKNEDLRVLGVDPAKNIARIASRLGVPTIPKFFDASLARSLQKKYGQAGIITANNTIANVDNLDEFTEGIRDLLSPNGVFVFETSYLNDIIKNMIFDVIYHEHISYFSISPLVSFFKKHGLELIDVIHIPTKGGSIRCTVQLAGGPRKISASVNNFISSEKKSGLHTKKKFRIFESSIKKTKKQLWQILNRLIKKGKSIAGFGASTTTTTLTYHFDLVRVLPYLIDENPIKIHTFSPGEHIQVLPPDTINERRPNYILIMAWRFADQIIEKNKQYLKQGGHFVIPLPKVRVI